ncbi:MAG: DMT family transporter [Prolixibacteraceae bacterium]|jgi:drug/metabolite transporter (DMT)-like permease|nr:DMT family transporter [Prolixibacteraceae bacterium]
MNNNLKKIIKSTEVMAITACFLWSTAFAGVKIGLNYMTPLQFAGIRFFLAGLLIMLFFGKYRLYFRTIRKHFPYILGIGLLQTTFMYSLFYTGLNMVPGAVGAMVIGSGPLFAAIVAHFAMNNDKMNIRTSSGILMGLIGIMIINLGRQATGIGDTLEIVGVLLLISNNIIGGIASVIVVKNKRPIPMLVLSSAQLALGGFLLFLISIPVEGFQLTQVFPAEFWLSLGWLSFLSAAAFALWFTLLKRPGTKISYLNSWKFIIPVLGAALSWIMLPSESPDTYAIVGMVFVAGAMLVMNHEALTRILFRRINVKE